MGSIRFIYCQSHSDDKQSLQATARTSIRTLELSAARTCPLIVLSPLKQVSKMRPTASATPALITTSNRSALICSHNKADKRICKKNAEFKSTHHDSAVLPASLPPRVFNWTFKTLMAVLPCWHSTVRSESALQACDPRAWSCALQAFASSPLTYR